MAEQEDGPEYLAALSSDRLGADLHRAPCKWPSKKPCRGNPGKARFYNWVFTRTKWGDNTRDLRRRYTTGVGAHAVVAHRVRP